MKKIIILIFYFLFFTNLLYSEQTYSIIESSFININNIKDNNIHTFSISGDINNAEQQIVLNLKKRKYIKQIHIKFTGKIKKIPIRILGSDDYINWKMFKKVYILKKDLVIKINNYSARFLKINIPQNIKPATSELKLKISELDIDYSYNIKPKIFNVKILNITEHTITFIWNTDYDTFGQIRYGRDVNNINNVKTEFAFTKKHKITIDNLLKGTKYFYQIINLTAEQKVISTPLKSFKTKGIPLPEIVSVKILKKYYNGADFEIIANVKVKLRIFYNGKNKKYNTLKRKHLIKLRGLEPQKEYHYKIIISDQFNNTFIKEGDFSTAEYNIALNKKVYGTFKNKYIGDKFSLKGDILKRVTDGIFTYKSGMAVSFDPAVSDQYVIIDLGSKQKIKNIITYWRALAYPYFYYIFFSNDMKNWHRYNSIIKLTDNKRKRIKGAGMPLIIENTKINNISARYVKIFIPKGTPYFKKFKFYKFIQLVEVKISGKWNK